MVCGMPRMVDDDCLLVAGCFLLSLTVGMSNGGSIVRLQLPARIAQEGLRRFMRGCIIQVGGPESFGWQDISNLEACFEETTATRYMAAFPDE